MSYDSDQSFAQNVVEKAIKNSGWKFNNAGTTNVTKEELLEVFVPAIKEVEEALY